MFILEIQTKILIIFYIEIMYLFQSVIINNKTYFSCFFLNSNLYFYFIFFLIFEKLKRKLFDSSIIEATNCYPCYLLKDSFFYREIYIVPTYTLHFYPTWPDFYVSSCQWKLKLHCLHRYCFFYLLNLISNSKTEIL